MSVKSNEEEIRVQFLDVQNRPEVNSDEYFANILSGRGEIEGMFHDNLLFARYLNYRALELDNEGQYEEAINLLKLAIVQDNSWDTLYRNLGNLYYLIDEYDEALENYNILLSINPNYTNIYNYIASAYYKIAQNISFVDPNTDNAEDRKGYFLSQAKVNLELHFKNEELHSINSVELFAQINHELGNNKAACDLYLYLSDKFTSHKSYFLDKILEINPDNIDILYKKATLSIENNNYSGALDCYKKLAKLDPDNVEEQINSHIQNRPNSTELLSISGHVALELNKPKKALECFKLVIMTKLEDEDEIFAGDYFNVAKTCFKLKKYLKTLKYSDMAIEAGLRSEELFTLKINAASKTHDDDTLEKSYKSIIALDQEHPRWHILYGKFLSKLNRPEEAKDICNSVREKFPDYYNECKDKLEEYIKADNIVKAMYYADSLIFLDCNNSVGHFYKGFLLNKVGDFDQAILHSETAKKLGCFDNVVKFELAISYFAKANLVPEDSDEAKSNFNEALYNICLIENWFHNMEPKFYFLKAQILLQNKQENHALECLNKLLLEWNNIEAMWLKSQILENLGEHEAARLSYNKIVEINQGYDIKYYFSEAKFKVAMIDFSKNKYLSARENLEEALENNPNFTEAYSKYNEITVLDKKEIEALCFYNNLLKLNENNEQAHFYKAELCVQMKSNKAAKISLEEVLKINPSNDSAKELLQNIIKEEARSISKRKLETYEDSSEAHVKSSDVNSTPTKKSKASPENSQNNSPNIGEVTPKRPLDLSNNAENDETPSKKLRISALNLDDPDYTSGSVSSEEGSSVNISSFFDEYIINNNDSRSIFGAAAPLDSEN